MQLLRENCPIDLVVDNIVDNIKSTKRAGEKLVDVTRFLTDTQIRDEKFCSDLCFILEGMGHECHYKHDKPTVIDSGDGVEFEFIIKEFYIMIGDDE